MYARASQMCASLATTLYDYIVVPNYLAIAVVDIDCSSFYLKLIMFEASFLLNTRILVWVYTNMLFLIYMILG